MIYFHLPIVPSKVTSQTKRLVMVGGKPMFFAKKDHQSAENDLLLLCSAHVPFYPIIGPVILTVKFVFPWKKNETKRNIARVIIPNSTRPDCDNLVKLVGDVLTKLQFYKDDGQVFELLMICCARTPLPKAVGEKESKIVLQYPATRSG